MEKRHLSHGGLYPGEYVVVTISDQGPGIADAARRRLFEPFFTTKTWGTGLGLSTAWEIIQDHGGTIHVENERNGGARFCVWLPEAPKHADIPLTSDGGRILLLTEADRLEAEEEMLAELGYETLGVSIETAIEEILKLSREFDTILIATWRSWRVEELIAKLSPSLDEQPILVAAPNADVLRSRLLCEALAYPLQASNAAFQLAQRGRKSNGAHPRETQIIHLATNSTE
jgi:hypothetical protein